MATKISKYTAQNWIIAIDDSDLEMVKYLHSIYPGLLNKSISSHNYTALYLSCTLVHCDIKIFNYLIEQEKLNVNKKSYNGKSVLEYMTYQLSFMNKKTEHILNKLLMHPKIIIDKNFFNLIHKRSHKFFNKYILQKTIIENNIENYKAFIESDNSKKLIHSKIRIEYPQLFAGIELGLL